MIPRILATLLLTGFLGGCASLPSAGGAGAPAGGTDAAAASAAGNLGIKETLVQVAMTAAKDYLSKSSSAVQSGAAAAQQSAAEKEAAAKVGVQAAVDKANADGQPITESQQTGLLSVLKNFL